MYSYDLNIYLISFQYKPRIYSRLPWTYVLYAYLRLVLCTIYYIGFILVTNTTITSHSTSLVCNIQFTYYRTRVRGRVRYTSSSRLETRIIGSLGYSADDGPKNFHSGIIKIY